MPCSFVRILPLAAIVAATGATLFADSIPVSQQRALLDRYCVTCHNQKLKTGGLMLDRMDLDKPADGAETHYPTWWQERGQGVSKEAGIFATRTIRPCRISC